MAVNYAYNFAIIDRASTMCVEVRSSTRDESGSSTDTELYVLVPVYDEEYLFKYYNEADGKFYYDPEYTQEYISPLL